MEGAEFEPAVRVAREPVLGFPKTRRAQALAAGDETGLWVMREILR